MSLLLVIGCFVISSAIPHVRDSDDGKRLLSNELNYNIINGDPPTFNRPFYVRVKGRLHRVWSFCGATVVERQWIITSATCVHEIPRRHIFVDVGTFTTDDQMFRTVRVTAKFLAPGFEEGIAPQNDLALLRLADTVESFRVLPLCQDEFQLGTRYGACGMGSTSRQRIGIPEVLMETQFIESRFHSSDWHNLQYCSPDRICTVSITRDAGISMMDEGGPLFTFECGSSKAHCLYGVASYYSEEEDTSYFASVIYFKDWLHQVIRNHS